MPAISRVRSPGSPPESGETPRSAIALAFAVALGLLFGCAHPTHGTQPGIDLLSLPVRSSQIRPHAEFMALLDESTSRGDRWPKDPTQVALRFSEWADPPREWVAVLHGTGERASAYHVVIIANGFSDDSIQGERLDIELERAADETWHIRSAAESWRCWPGRGHTDFGVEPCT